MKSRCCCGVVSPESLDHEQSGNKDNHKRNSRLDALVLCRGAAGLAGGLKLEGALWRCSGRRLGRSGGGGGGGSSGRDSRSGRDDRGNTSGGRKDRLSGGQNRSSGRKSSRNGRDSP